MINVTQQTRQRTTSCAICEVRGVSPATNTSYTATEHIGDQEYVIYHLCHLHYVELVEAQNAMTRDARKRCTGCVD